MKTPIWIQIKYARLFGSLHVQGFVIKNNSPFLGNGRCPICGDSQKNKIKKRFYFYEKEGSILTSCHNCGHSSSLEGLLRGYDEYLYRQLLVERISDQTPRFDQEEKRSPKKETGDAWKSCLTPVVAVPKALKYLESRKIPRTHISRLFFTENLKHSYVDICDAIQVEVDQNKKVPEIEGIVFPFTDKSWNLPFITTRNLDPTDNLRYATLEFTPSYKIFGLDRVDEKKPIIVTEGPIDSLFCNNAIATGDSSLDRAAQVFAKENLILVPDNEPRAPVQTKRIKKFIDSGFNVVLFPSSVKEKDLNDMTKAGYNVQELIDLNTFSGLRAKLQFEEWCLA